VDTTRVDQLARTLGATPTRRSVAGILAGLALGGGGPHPPGSADAGKRKCKPCQRKRRGKCRGKKPDGTPCGADRECCDGACKALCAPTELRDPVTCGCCLRDGEACVPGPEACCSGSCVISTGNPVGVCAAPAG
jgi:hypothetical protein